MADVTVLVMTDGRPYIWDTLPAAIDMLGEQVTDWVIHDDSGDPANRAALAERFGFPVIGRPQRVGYAHAMRHAWQWMSTNARPYILHLEDDFIFERRPEVDAMRGLLAEHPHLVQVALLRQPWSPEEVAAGGIVEVTPDEYTARTDGIWHWLEHRRWFTVNPCLYRRGLAATHRWPLGSNSEWRFSRSLYRGDPHRRGAYWGQAGDPPAVRHVGQNRAGTEY